MNFLPVTQIVYSLSKKVKYIHFGGILYQQALLVSRLSVLVRLIQVKSSSIQVIHLNVRLVFIIVLHEGL